ncbi:hypothetical protein CJ030_MR5G021733 [Morella rubra]|uniref:Uncharacterized protein n=1 Tax=Morella rubra TaxID=262757 RepID=A0A6A1VKM1_9ROSI|nr:hypothetical protein CJ030_MR5G021733 [Morella rubra]
MTLADPKMFMEAMMSEMKHMIKSEMEQFHEQIEQMENSLQPQNNPNFRRRERVPRKEARVEDKEPYGSGFEEEEYRNSVISYRRHERRVREARNLEDNNFEINII